MHLYSLFSLVMARSSQSEHMTEFFCRVREKKKKEWEERKEREEEEEERTLRGREERENRGGSVGKGKEEKRVGKEGWRRRRWADREAKKDKEGRGISFSSPLHTHART